MTDSEARDSWTLLTAHGHVLVEVARNPDVRVREISTAVGLTERAVHAIISDLEKAGYVTRTKVGRRNRYTVDLDNPFRHPAQRDLRVGPFLDMLTGSPAESGRSRSEIRPDTASPAI